MKSTTLMQLICCLIALFIQIELVGQTKEYTISGYVTDEETGETLIGATIQKAGTSQGTITNVYGFYSFTMSAGEHSLIISYAGFDRQNISVSLNQNLEKNIILKSNTAVLQEVVVTGQSEDHHIKENNIGLISLKSSSIASIPAIGEADIIRAIKLLPGIQSTSETSSGFSVRGGSPDQNLILLDEAVVYNPSHLLGFYSTFNNDAVKNVQLYKGNIPAKYGGRLSSVLDVRMKEGNNQKVSGNGGIGLIAARATLEAPIVKDKGSIIVSGRRTYADLIARTFRNDSTIDNSTLYFYDLNLKANYKLGQKDRIFVSSYLGRDVFDLDDTFSLAWGNNTITSRWNHIFSPKLFSNTSFVYSRYEYNLGFGDNDFNLDWKSALRDYTVKLDFDYFLNPKNNLTFGIHSSYHRIEPGTIKVTSGEEIDQTNTISEENALEHSVFIGNEQQISSNLKLNYGFRATLFQNIGPGVEYVYNDMFERTDSINHSAGNIYNSYLRFEPRFAINYQLNKSSAIKGSYVKTHQFIQLASNSVGGSPLDIWFLASPNTLPQESDQISLGYFRNFADNKIETSIETYYRSINNQIDFKDQASLILNEELENELRVGNGWAYGVELLLKKPAGRFNGWFSFTWSASRRKIPFVNEGRTFRSSFDRPINLSLVGNYKLNDRWSINGTFTYYSGQAFTRPSSRFNFGNIIVPRYTERNDGRLPSYHRMDVGVTLQSKNNKIKKLKGEWVLAVYNAYGRRNPNIITFQQVENNRTEATQFSIFRWVPTITYNFRF